MGENPSRTAPTEEGGGVNKWVIGGLLLLLLLILGAFVFEIVSLGRGAENHERRITVLEKNDLQTARKIKALATIGSSETKLGKIEAAIKDHERRLHSKKSAVKHRPIPRRLKVAPAKEADTAAILANAIKSCADRGGELVSENGKAACVTKVATKPDQIDPPKVAQLGTSKVGTQCFSGDRSGTYQIINGQIACLLDGVVRVTESYQRPEPEVVYAEPRRIIREEFPRQQEEETYYEEDQRGGLSSLLPWGIAAGALWWGSTRNNSSAAAVATGRLPGVITGPAGPGVITGPAW